MDSAERAQLRVPRDIASPYRNQIATSCDLARRRTHGGRERARYNACALGDPPPRVMLMCESLPSDLSDASLRRAMPDIVASERSSIAVVVAYLAEFERRRLHTADGYPTLFVYAVEGLGYSDDAAWRRVKAAELSRDYPVILGMLADGRLHLTAITMLAPHLTRTNADELFAVVARKGKKAIERALAERFPRADLPTRLEPVAPVESQDNSTLCIVALARRDTRLPDASPSIAQEIVSAPHARVTQRAPERYGLQVTIDQTTHDLLRRAQDLLSHQVPNGDLATVLRHVLEAALPQLEKRKFGTSRAPRTTGSAKGRHIPMHVKNAVWKRDGGRCTYVADNGRRCESRKFLEFDHEIPFARGGEATIGNIRLRCRAHNQFEAQRTFGAGFMEGRRERSQPHTGHAS